MSQPNLDDRAWVTRSDPKGMLARFESFHSQCREALSIAVVGSIPELSARPNVVALTGMGGSAAGGDFVRMLFEESGNIPFVVNRDYTLPHYVRMGDLVFCASYSGNTEETLSAYASAKQAGATIVAVTSGGRLAETARVDGHTVITIPGGAPPRAALGYMTLPVIVVCQKLKLLPSIDFELAFDLLAQCGRRWTVESTERNAAKDLARACHGKMIALYGLGGWQGVIANRWKGQINENSKNIALTNVFPELDHNEILGWSGISGQSDADWVAIALQDGSESAKMKARAAVTERLIGDRVEFLPAMAPGETLFEKMLALSSLGDFVSIYLAALNGVDPGEMAVLDTLKAELGKV